MGSTPQRFRVAAANDATTTVFASCRRRRKAALNVWLARTGEDRHLPEKDSSLNGDVSMGDNLGSLIFIKPKPVAS